MLMCQVSSERWTSNLHRPFQYDSMTQAYIFQCSSGYAGEFGAWRNEGKIRFVVGRHASGFRQITSLNYGSSASQPKHHQQLEGDAFLN